MEDIEDRLRQIAEETMSESTIVDPQGNPVEEVEPKEEQEQPQAQQGTEIPTTPAIPPTNVGYAIGLKPDGDFYFEVFGAQPGLVQLLGLHEIATSRIKHMVEVNQGLGSGMTLPALAQVQQMLKVILNMLTQQSKDSLLKR